LASVPVLGMLLPVLQSIKPFKTKLNEGQLLVVLELKVHWELLKV
jgi:hypothetical protein